MQDRQSRDDAADRCGRGTAGRSAGPSSRRRDELIDKDWTFVLGAQDPEMREIERVLDDDARPWMHAAKGRRRCTAQTAYEANGVVRVGPDNIPRAIVLPPKAPVVFVECGLVGWEPLLRVDHHHPGDPGYTAAPEHYLRGSLLRQV